jgi:NAD(P)-dependent dehydrogenase (short-subunit alcohol dehydrogenase family)
MSKKIILITGASSGFGRLTAEALAKAGHTVYPSMRDVAGRNAKNAAEMVKMSAVDGIDLRAVELDVQSEASTNAAVEKIVAESGQIDVLVHNAGHMTFGPAEAFTPEQVRPTIRRQRAGRQTGQPRGAAAHARPEAGPPGVGLQQQHCRRHAALPVALFRG